MGSVLYDISLSAVRVIGDSRVFNKYEVKICCRFQILYIVCKDRIAVCIYGLYPFAVFLLFGQRACIFNFVSRQLNKFDDGSSVFVSPCTIDPDELTTVP